MISRKIWMTEKFLNFTLAYLYNNGFIYHIYLENCTPVANLENAWQQKLGKTFSFSDFWCWECVVKTSVVLINPFGTFGISCNQKKKCADFFFFSIWSWRLEKCSIKTSMRFKIICLIWRVFLQIFTFQMQLKLLLLQFHA